MALIVYAIPSSEKVLATSLLTASASFASGALLGFLFGIPRSLAASRQENDDDAAGAASRRLIEPNTNLEQISDWLTKILVGIGLVQLKQIGEGIGNLAEGLAPGLGGEPNGQAVAIALMVSFAITGFLCAYLFTRLRLQGAFALADVIDAAVGERADVETRALALVRSQLDLDGDDGPPQKELAEAIKKASPGTRAQAFFQARDQRRSGWRNDESQLIPLTIPVFRALIASDAKNHFHRNHGELGYALKDQPEPDYQAARDSLSTAIRIRGNSRVARFALYEFSRAICNIMLDADFKAGRPSGETAIASVVADLGVAAGSRLGRAAFRREKTVREWVDRNDVDPRVAGLRPKLEAP